MSPAASSEPPRVSVVICVVDPHPVYFPLAVRSVLSQSLGALELIVVEEPSSRSAAPLLAAFDDPRIRHLAHPTRTSLVEQRNRGIEQARAELVAVLDADDIAEPERLALQAAYMDAHPEVAVLGTQLRLIDPEGETLGLRRYPTEPAELSRALERFNPIAQPAVMYRKAAVQAAGGYQHGPFEVIEDYELWCRLHAQGASMANLDAPLVRYRIHPGGQKATKLRATLRATIGLKQAHFGATMSAPARLRLAAERALLRLPPRLVLWLFVRATTAAS